ncbi:MULTISPECIES: hypothetical protein [Leptolyngbya]|jgi:hypothetical protein|nr:MULTISPECIES: hypothetical protein [Leptolyngbya]MBD1855373.1 hypothetical protein [Leptolyngbya sp. FACHB-1624]BAS58547.1 hypothetical protein LBWT_45130 [Leptolyngbya boryana IAM M-101]BAS64895.1 hypothetical protein LBDG_45130 [Leptolyngbya boryana dg5]
MMYIPAIFFGSSKEVRDRCKGLVKQFLKGTSWQEIMNAQELISTQDHPGLIVLHGPDRMMDSYGSHFHCYRLWEQLKEQQYKGNVTWDMEDEIFNTSLQADWGLLGLLALRNEPWVWYRENLYSVEDWTTRRCIPIISACLRYWNGIYAEGNRFSNGSATANNLWALPNSLKYVLANLGVPLPVLQSPLPEGGLQAILPPELLA